VVFHIPGCTNTAVCLSEATAADQWDVERQGSYRQVHDVIPPLVNSYKTLSQRFDVLPLHSVVARVKWFVPWWILAWASFSSLTLKRFTHPVSSLSNHWQSEISPQMPSRHFGDHAADALSSNLYPSEQSDRSLSTQNAGAPAYLRKQLEDRLQCLLSTSASQQASMGRLITICTSRIPRGDSPQ